MLQQIIYRDILLRKRHCCTSEPWLSSCLDNCRIILQVLASFSDDRNQHCADTAMHMKFMCQKSDVAPTWRATKPQKNALRKRVDAALHSETRQYSFSTTVHCAQPQ